jgi:ABC-type nitrate/sulfonate/bicarbonate transport system ATPase subunit
MVTNSIEEAILLGERIIALSDTPSAIIGVWDVGIHYEEKRGNLQKNQMFQKLRQKIRQTLESQSSKEAPFVE